jgi:hypothetical protein
MMRARLLLVACMIAGASFGTARPADASPCWDGLMSDTAACLGSRSSCLASSSFWTSTCNLQYLACETGAELAYADCMVYALMAN